MLKEGTHSPGRGTLPKHMGTVGSRNLTSGKIPRGSPATWAGAPEAHPMPARTWNPTQQQPPPGLLMRVLPQKVPGEPKHRTQTGAGHAHIFGSKGRNIWDNASMEKAPAGIRAEDQAKDMGIDRGHASVRGRTQAEGSLNTGGTGSRDPVMPGPELQLGRLLHREDRLGMILCGDCEEAENHTQSGLVGRDPCGP